MALEVTNLTRKFSFKKDGKDIDIPDPNPEMTAEEIMKMNAAVYPELTNGMVTGPVVIDDKAIYTFTTKAGKLG